MAVDVSDVVMGKELKVSKVECEVLYSTDFNDDGVEVDCVVAICSRCGHETTSWGDGTASVKRCFAVMSEECPNSENNFYVQE